MQPAPYRPQPHHGHQIVDIHHYVVCRHRVEVEISPGRIELSFGDEKWVNPINTQMRFEATVYNSERGVNWSVRDLAGNPGAGSIDAAGLYRAPSKSGRPNGFTEIVVATAKEDPLRKAFAWVTLLGEGPAPAPTPSIAILPKSAHLYYQTGLHNAYIDGSNKQQAFRATIRDSNLTVVEWLVDGILQPGQTGPSFLYLTAGAGAPRIVTVRARIKNDPLSTFDEARVNTLNYFWPGL